jgi:hypothetical protein
MVTHEHLRLVLLEVVTHEHLRLVPLEVVTHERLRLVLLEMVTHERLRLVLVEMVTHERLIQNHLSKGQGEQKIITKKQPPNQALNMLKSIDKRHTLLLRALVTRNRIINFVINKSFVC